MVNFYDHVFQSLSSLVLESIFYCSHSFHKHIVACAGEYLPLQLFIPQTPCRLLRRLSFGMHVGSTNTVSRDWETSRLSLQSASDMYSQMLVVLGYGHATLLKCTVSELTGVECSALNVQMMCGKRGCDKRLGRGIEALRIRAQLGIASQICPPRFLTSNDTAI